MKLQSWKHFLSLLADGCPELGSLTMDDWWSMETQKRLNRLSKRQKELVDASQRAIIEHGDMVRASHRALPVARSLANPAPEASEEPVCQTDSCACGRRAH